MTAFGLDPMSLTLPICENPTFFAGVDLARAMVAMSRGGTVSMADFTDLAIQQYGDTLSEDDVRMACAFAPPPHSKTSTPSAWVRISVENHEKLTAIKERLQMRTRDGANVRAIMHSLLWKRAFWHHQMQGIDPNGTDSTRYRVKLTRLPEAATDPV
jgi:hypothetical protein